MSAIRKHLGDFLAIIALFVIGMGVAVYILDQQRFRFPLIEDKPFVVKAELSDAQAVQPGQGQTVRVAGVEIGAIGQVELEDGIAVVEMEIEKDYEGLIREDATALLRPKTGLKDMFLEIDPGEGRPMAENEAIPVENTAPDIDPDEILSALDADTRDYLKLLISGAGKGLKGRGNDLREVFKRFEPLHRDLAKVTTAVASRKQALKRLIHNYGLLTAELAKKDEDLTRLVVASNQVFDAFASEDQNVSATVAKLPGALRQTEQTLRKVDRFAQVLGPALEDLRPAFRQLDDANLAVRPFVLEAEPIIRKQIRPFVQLEQRTGFTRDLERAAVNLNVALPDLTTSFGQLNRFFNIGAFNPGGAQGLSGNSQQDRSTSQGPQGQGRKEGYLYWLAWVAQNGVSLHQNADATGVIRRVTLCALGADGQFVDPFALLAGGAANLSEPALLPQLVAAGEAAGLILAPGEASVCPE